MGRVLLDLDFGTPYICGHRSPRTWWSAVQGDAVAPCLAALVGWIGRWWQGTPLAVAWEATTGGGRGSRLAVRVVSKGSALPVPWCLLPAGPQLPAQCPKKPLLLAV